MLQPCVLNVKAADDHTSVRPLAAQIAGLDDLAMLAADTLFKTLISKLAGAVFDKLFDKVFPPGGSVPSYFGEVYKEMSALTGQVIQKDEITKINGQLTNVTDKLRNEYIPRKAQMTARDPSLAEMVSRTELCAI